MKHLLLVILSVLSIAASAQDEAYFEVAGKSFMTIFHENFMLPQSVYDSEFSEVFFCRVELDTVAKPKVCIFGLSDSTFREKLNGFFNTYAYGWKKQDKRTMVFIPFMILVSNSLNYDSLKLNGHIYSDFYYRRSQMNGLNYELMHGAGYQFLPIIFYAGESPPMKYEHEQLPPGFTPPTKGNTGGKKN